MYFIGIGYMNKKYKNLNNFATSHTMYSLGLGNNLWPLEVDKECVWHEVWDTKDEGSREGESNLKTKVGLVLALLEFKPIGTKRFGSNVW